MVNKTMGDDLVKRLRGGLALGEEAADRIKKLEAMMKWGDEISNIQAARIEELEANLAKAVNAIKLSLEAINRKVDSGDAFDSVCAILAELKGGTRGED